MWVYVVLSRCVFDNLCCRPCTESLLVFDEGADALYDFTYLDVDIQQEVAAFPSSHYHDFSGYTLAR